MADLQLSSFISILPHYRLSSNDERVMFDWLVFKCSYNLDGYTHSIPQIQKETMVARYSQEKIIAKFCEMGFLKVEKVLIQNCPYKNFRIDFGILSKTETLENIIDPSTPTFNTLTTAFRELADEQKKQGKANTKTRREKTQKASHLYDELNEIYRQRVDLFNKGRTKGKKIKTSISKSRATTALLNRASHEYEVDSIKNAFVAYADAVIKGTITPTNILAYFLKCESGDFPVISYYLDHLNTSYTYG